MSRKLKNFLFYIKNDYLVKSNLIPIKEISKIINLVNEILIKEKNKKIETKNQGGTQTHNNYTFAKKGPLHFYVSTSKNI
jgi:hypothetical protein|tara:strand:+ start:2048 stop:2287 length:240 start_codon:yes stop_codon:yes gene_type:complete